MMGNVELAPEVEVSALEPLLSSSVVSELLDTYMSTLTVSRTGLQFQKVVVVCLECGETSELTLPQ